MSRGSSSIAHTHRGRCSTNTQMSSPVEDQFPSGDRRTPKAIVRRHHPLRRTMSTIASSNLKMKSLLLIAAMCSTVRGMQHKRPGWNNIDSQIEPHKVKHNPSGYDNLLSRGTGADSGSVTHQESREWVENNFGLPPFDPSNGSAKRKGGSNWWGVGGAIGALATVAGGSIIAAGVGKKAMNAAQEETLNKAKENFESILEKAKEKIAEGQEIELPTFEAPETGSEDVFENLASDIVEFFGNDPNIAIGVGVGVMVLGIVLMIFFFHKCRTGTFKIWHC